MLSSAFPVIVICSLNGQSNEIFDLQFFSSFELVWATDQKVKIFSFLVSFRRDIQILVLKKLTPRSIILCGALKNTYISTKTKPKTKYFNPLFRWVKLSNSWAGLSRSSFSGLCRSTVVLYSIFHSGWKGLHYRMPPTPCHFGEPLAEGSSYRSPPCHSGAPLAEGVIKP